MELYSCIKNFKCFLINFSNQHNYEKFFKFVKFFWMFFNFGLLRSITVNIMVQLILRQWFSDCRFSFFCFFFVCALCTTVSWQRTVISKDPAFCWRTRFFRGGFWTLWKIEHPIITVLGLCRVPIGRILPTRWAAASKKSLAYVCCTFENNNWSKSCILPENLSYSYFFSILTTRTTTEKNIRIKLISGWVDRASATATIDQRFDSQAD